MGIFDDDVGDWDMFNDRAALVEAALDEFLDMTPEQRSFYYDEFFAEWDLDDDELGVFWDLYDEAG